MNLRPLGARFGAEVRDIDLTDDIPDATRRALAAALATHQLLLFRDQRLTPEHQARLGSCFGQLRPAYQAEHHPCSHEHVHYIANVDLEGRSIDTHPDPYSACWHSDGSWSAQPAKATVLHAVRVPASGSTTQFADMHSLLEGLPMPLRDDVASWRVVHDVELSRAGRDRRWPWQWRRGRGGPAPTEHFRDGARLLRRALQRDLTTHPAVRVHPETGRRLLFLGDHAWRVVGMAWPHGVRMVRRLNDIEPAPPATITHRWRPGDVLAWDNRSLLHRVGPYELGEARIMQRCVILGDPAETP